MQFNFRKIFIVMTLALLLATMVSTLYADPVTVNDPALCPIGTIATPFTSEEWTCEPDPHYSPCLGAGGMGAAGDPCSPLPPKDPCSFPFGTAGAAIACPPAPVVNPPTSNPPPAPGKEGEISFNDSDLGVALIKVEDENGNAVLEVFDMANHTTNGNYMFSITQEDLAPFAGNLPAENTLLRAEGHVAVYVLTTGEIQFNVGPDSEGKIHVKIFDGIPWTHVYGYVIEPA